MKIKNKQGLFFGVTMTIYFIVRDIWQAPQLTTAIVTKSVFAGIVAGAIAGLAYGFIMSKLRPKIIKQSNQPNKSTL